MEPSIKVMNSQLRLYPCLAENNLAFTFIRKELVFYPIFRNRFVLSVFNATAAKMREEFVYVSVPNNLTHATRSLLYRYGLIEERAEIKQNGCTYNVFGLNLFGHSLMSSMESGKVWITNDVNGDTSKRLTQNFYKKVATFNYGEARLQSYHTNFRVYSSDHSESSINLTDQELEEIATNPRLLKAEGGPEFRQKLILGKLSRD